MKYYDKEKHFSLIKEHLKRAALEKLDLDMCSRFDNYGKVLTELRINETDAILIDGTELQEICYEVCGKTDFHQAMMDYYAQGWNRLLTEIRCDQVEWGITPKQPTVFNKAAVIGNDENKEQPKTEKRIIKTDYTKESRQ